MIRHSTSRELLFNSNLDFYAPEELFQEIEEHREEIMHKSGLDEKSFNRLVWIIRQAIKTMRKEDYAENLKDAEKIISDAQDLPFAAAAMSLGKSGIWTNDKHFHAKKAPLEQQGITVFGTKELAGEVERLTTD